MDLQQLETQVRRLLQDLPARRAPSTLAAQVLSRIGKRARLHWWQRAVVDWPPLARGLFVALCAGLISLTVRGGLWSADRLATLWRESMPAPLKALADLAASLARAIPLEWAYVGALLAAALYGGVIALGAAGYRMLYRESE